MTSVKCSKITKLKPKIAKFKIFKKKCLSLIFLLISFTPCFQIFKILVSNCCCECVQWWLSHGPGLNWTGPGHGLSDARACPWRLHNSVIKTRHRTSEPRSILLLGCLKFSLLVSFTCHVIDGLWRTIFRLVRVSNTPDILMIIIKQKLGLPSAAPDWEHTPMLPVTKPAFNLPRKAFIHILNKQQGGANCLV